MLRRVLQSERGNIAVISAIILPVLLGGLGVGFETAGWYQTQRSMQNAADSAAIAAATNNSSSYATEADAVTAQYGFTDGVAGVTVTASNTAACPAGGNTCFSVTITKPAPLYLIQLLGFHGDTTLNGAYAQQLSATAIASEQTSPHNYCLLALGQNAGGITGNGVPFADLQGCSVFSNSDATCNGHNLNAGYGDAHGKSTGCGVYQDSGLAVLPDPYSFLAADIPADPCPNTLPAGVTSEYPQEPTKQKDPALPNVTGTGACSNETWGATLSGNITWGATQFFHGDVQLTGDVNLTTASPGAVMVIEDGQLDTNGHTLKTLAGSGLTIIFTSPSADYASASYTHAPTGGGTLDVSSPTTGTWKGVAMYQDPNLTAGVTVASAGNSPTWDISGLVYLPNSNVTFSGAVNKASNGNACFDLVTFSVVINGTGSILNDEGHCDLQGLTLPSEQVPTRGSLVA